MQYLAASFLSVVALACCGDPGPAAALSVPQAFEGAGENHSPIARSPGLSSFVLRVALERDGTVAVSFPTEPGVTYQVQFSAASDSPVWLPLGNILVSTGKTACYRLPCDSDALMFRAVKVPLSMVTPEKTDLEIDFWASQTLLSDSLGTNHPHPAVVDGTPVRLVAQWEEEDGPSVWVEKVAWLLKQMPLIAEPFSKGPN